MKRIFTERDRGEKGFTLIELLMVIAIIVVLAAIIMTTLAGRTDEARDSVDRANLKIIQGAVDVYYVDQGAYPAGLDNLYEDNDRGEPYLRTPREEIEADGNTYIICQDTGEVTVAAIPEEE